MHHLLTTFNSNYLSITAAAVNLTYDDLYIYFIKGFLTYLFTGRYTGHCQVFVRRTQSHRTSLRQLLLLHSLRQVGPRTWTTQQILPDQQAWQQGGEPEEEVLPVLQRLDLQVQLRPARQKQASRQVREEELSERHSKGSPYKKIFWQLPCCCQVRAGRGQEGISGRQAGEGHLKEEGCSRPKAIFQNISCSNKVARFAETSEEKALKQNISGCRQRLKEEAKDVYSSIQSFGHRATPGRSLLNSAGRTEFLHWCSKDRCKILSLILWIVI